MNSQCASILKCLQSGRSVTPLTALDRWGCFRLAARIRDLKDRGHRIETHIINVGRKKVAAYLLGI